VTWQAAQGRIAALEAAIRELTAECRGLADQQAMPDDTWISTVNHAAALLGEEVDGE
jgi:hypothetical protein